MNKENDLDKVKAIENIDKKGNRIICLGGFSKINSDIKFEGKNNILYCDRNAVIEESNLCFVGNNSLIYLGMGKHRIKVSVWNDSVCHFGSNNSYTRPFWASISERKHLFIGDNCVVSTDVCARNSDAHLIYDCENRKRINPSKSIFIGDHVWIGQNTFILKGARVDSGSIIGAKSVIASNNIPHNSICAGNPFRIIKRGVFWDKTIVHDFDLEDTEISMDYESFLRNNRSDNCHTDYWTFNYCQNEEISWDYLDKKLSDGSAVEKLKFLDELNRNKTKNRFVHLDTTN